MWLIKSDLKAPEKNVVRLFEDFPFRYRLYVRLFPPFLEGGEEQQGDEYLKFQFR